MTNLMRSVVLWLTLAVAGLWAQPPRGFFPWWDSPLARDIKLSEDQQRQVRDVVRDYRGKLIDARAAVEKAEAEVEDLFNEDQTDARRAGEAVDKLVAARGEMTRAYSQMSLKLRAVLTAQQWRELRERRGPARKPGSMPEPMRMRKGPYRPEGPGRPGGPPETRQPPQPPQPPRPRKVPPAADGPIY